MFPPESVVYGVSDDGVGGGTRDPIEIGMRWCHEKLISGEASIMLGNLGEDHGSKRQRRPATACVRGKPSVCIRQERVACEHETDASPCLVHAENLADFLNSYLLDRCNVLARTAFNIPVLSSYAFMLSPSLKQFNANLSHAIAAWMQTKASFELIERETRLGETCPELEAGETDPVSLESMSGLFAIAGGMAIGALGLAFALRCVHESRDQYRRRNTVALPNGDIRAAPVEGGESCNTLDGASIEVAATVSEAACDSKADDPLRREVALLSDLVSQVYQTMNGNAGSPLARDVPEKPVASVHCCGPPHREDHWANSTALFTQGIAETQTHAAKMRGPPREGTEEAGSAASELLTVMRPIPSEVRFFSAPTFSLPSRAPEVQRAASAAVAAERAASATIAAKCAACDAFAADNDGAGAGPGWV